MKPDGRHRLMIAHGSEQERGGRITKRKIPGGEETVRSQPSSLRLESQTVAVLVAG